MAGKTLINGTAYKIKGGRTLVNGTAYGIKKGKTLVGGAAYDIKLEVEPTWQTVKTDYATGTKSGSYTNNSIDIIAAIIEYKSRKSGGGTTTSNAGAAFYSDDTVWGGDRYGNNGGSIDSLTKHTVAYTARGDSSYGQDIYVHILARW